MNNLSIHESALRGTPDFPIELYRVNCDSAKYKMQMHWHKDFELIRVLKGDLALTLNDKQFVLKENHCVLIPGGIIHGGMPTDCLYDCVVFTPAVLYATQKCRAYVKNYLQRPHFFKSDDDINMLFSLLAEKETGYEFKALGIIYKKAGELIAEKKESSVLPDEKIEKIKAALSMIEESYNRKITLEELAAACGMSPNYFSRLFKEITKQTPFEYILTYRIELSKEMLIKGEENVTEICYNCGFNDLSYFIHIFKKYMGVSPKAYVKKQKMLQMSEQQEKGDA